MAKERRDIKNRVLNKGEYQNGDGRYMYRYTGSDGKTRYVYSWTLTKTDRTPNGKTSGKCLRELEKEIAMDLYDGINSHAANKETLNNCFDAYMARRRNLKPSTRSVYIEYYNRYVRDNVGSKRISDIKYSDIYSLYDNLIYENKLMPSTVSNLQTILNPVFRIAVRDRKIRDNPCTGVMSEIYKEYNWTKNKRHALTIEQQKIFIQYVKSHNRFYRWYPLMVFLLGTGCRIGEALGLTWNDCDFDTGIIHITHSLTCNRERHFGENAFLIQTPKSKAGVRDIPMFDAVKSVLLEEKKRQLRDGFCNVAIGEYTGFVFVNQVGNLHHQNGVQMVIKRIVESYNKQEMILSKHQNREPILLPDFSPHILRHTFCTRLCETGTNIKVVQEIMGHTNIAMTMDVYNEATLELKKKSFEGIEDKMYIC